MKKLRTDVNSAAARILELIKAREKPSLLLAIDGRCGSGKTTLAGVLAEKAGAQVVHMDDFYLRPEQRTPERYAEPGGNVDWERLLEEVLEPLRGQGPVVYRPYDAHRQVMLEAVRLEAEPVTVIEGSYSCHPELWKYYDIRIFLDISPEEQLKRILRRNGPEGLDMFRSRWIPLEEEYFREFRPDRDCDRCFELE